MKKAKWFCRYAFFALFLEAAIIWCFMCQNTINQFEKITNATSYIDLVIDEYSQAVALMERIDFFYSMRLCGILACVGIFLIIVLLVVWNFKGEKFCAGLKEKRENKKTAEKKENKKAPSSTLLTRTPAKKEGYCGFCGEHYDDLPEFCGKCGNKTTK